MNDRTHEGTEFARWTWTPRTGATAAERGYAIEHHRPKRFRSAELADKVILWLTVGFVAAIVWGTL